MGFREAVICSSTEQEEAVAVDSPPHLRTKANNAILKRRRNLKGGKLLDDFIDGVDGLGSGQRAVGGRCDDIKGTFQELFGMKPV